MIPGSVNIATGFPIEDAYEDVIFEKEENAKQSGN